MFDSRSVCVEANKTIFRFVKGLAERKKPREIAYEISVETGTPEDQIYDDILKFLRVAALIGWFKEIVKEEVGAPAPQAE